MEPAYFGAVRPAAFVKFTTSEWRGEAVRPLEVTLDPHTQALVDVLVEVCVRESEMAQTPAKTSGPEMLLTRGGSDADSTTRQKSSRS